jgi:hypothetical protein
VFLIRIRIDFGRLDPDLHWECGSGSRRAKITHNNVLDPNRIDFDRLDPDLHWECEGKNDPIREKVKKFHVCQCWMFSFKD